MKKAGLFTIAGVSVVTLLGLVYLALTFDASQGGTTTVVTVSYTHLTLPTICSV